jgi:glutathione-regulated potassium-efflux system ancillary protein KefG
MQTLVLLFHPNLEKSKTNSSWKKALETAQNVTIRSHETGEFDVEAERAALLKADRIIFQHPLYWYAAPWMLKKWLEEVMGYGFAFGTAYQLEGKEWMHVVSCGGNESAYHSGASNGYSVDEFLRPYQQMAAYCKMKWLPAYTLFGAGTDDNALQESAKQLPHRISA